MPNPNIFIPIHDAACEAYTANQWQIVVSLLIPIIPALLKTEKFSINEENEFEVRLHASCNYLVAYCLRELNKPRAALRYAHQALHSRKIMPESLRFEEDDFEQDGCVKLIEELTEIIHSQTSSNSATQLNPSSTSNSVESLFPPISEGLNSTTAQQNINTRYIR